MAKITKKKIDKKIFIIIGLLGMLSIGLLFSFFVLANLFIQSRKIADLEEELVARNALINSLYEQENEDAKISQSDDFDKDSNEIDDSSRGEFINFNSSSLSSSYKALSSKYVFMQVPKDWTVTAYWGKYTPDDKEEIVTEISIKTDNYLDVRLYGVTLYGISGIVPVYFEDTPNSLDDYYGHNDAELTVSYYNSFLQVDKCKVKNDIAYCDFRGIPYVQYGGTRIVMVESNVWVVKRSGETGTYYLDDGPDWSIGGIDYSADFEGGWTPTKVEELTKVLDSIEFN